MMIKQKNRTYTIVLFLLMVMASCRSKNEVAKSNSGSGKELKNNSGKLSTTIGISEKDLSSKQMYSFIEEWYGVPYQYGGDSKAGVDCSAFTKKLYLEVYKKNISRTAGGQYEQSEKIKSENMKEGDLVFFKIESAKISHVGVYLRYNKFIHASTKKGIVISDLSEPYYKKYYFSSGRPK